MPRRMKFWKFLIHVIGIMLTRHIINESSLNNNRVIKIIERYLPDVKHVLLWTDLYEVTPEGQRFFFDKSCKYFNCYITKNRSLLSDIRYFDAIVFNVKDLGELSVPQMRGNNQKYIFAAKDSAEEYPVCDKMYDGFFNWTWTYRLDSTISYRFISAFNPISEELGSHFTWNKAMAPIDKPLQSLLSTKSRAAAVFLDKCKTRSNREGFIENLKIEMSKYNMTLDIFGECSAKKCKRKSMNTCAWRLKKQYFFYLALEESIAVDFVTQVVLPAYKNQVVPIVYGGADYSQYLPPGSYLNAMNLSISELAKTMYNSMQNRNLYHEFFKWRKYYSIQESQALDPCALCEALNEPLWLNEKTIFTLLREWWFPGYEWRCREKNWL